MAERVNTGGLKSFNYQSKKQQKLDKERKKEIELGYQQYYERKAIERKNKIIVYAIGIILLIIVGGYLVFRLLG